MTLPLLIGQYDSPFVRRVAITMTTYAMPFEHRNWSVFRDAERIARYNPLRRVPVLVRSDGEVLLESAAILDALDEAADDDRVLLPRSGPHRRAGLRIAALAMGMADKGVALVYENVARGKGEQSQRWRQRCALQVRDTLKLLERERAAIASSWWFGERLSHPDIALGVAMHFIVQAAPDVAAELELPALRAHEARCHALATFREIDDPLHFPD